MERSRYPKLSRREVIARLRVKYEQSREMLDTMIRDGVVLFTK